MASVRPGRGLVGAGFGVSYRVVGRQTILAVVAITLLIVNMGAPRAVAAPTLPPNPGPSSNSIGLQATISTAPPKKGATITVPGNGATFTSVPITVSGLCPSNLLVKIFANNTFVGSTVCSNGSYSLKVDLFGGRNDLVARVYNALDQAGPDSNTVSVTFNDAQFITFGTPLSLTSLYAERGAPPGSELDWPIILSGGTSPYAVSVDWGDGSSAELLSASTAGTLTMKHIYKTAGVYQVVVKATDKNGGTAFLQLVGQATGAVQSNNKSSSTNNNVVIQKQVLWWPAVAMLPLVLLSFWVGRRHELRRLRRGPQD